MKATGTTHGNISHTQITLFKQPEDYWPRATFLQVLKAHVSKPEGAEGISNSSFL